MEVTFSVLVQKITEKFDKDAKTEDSEDVEAALN